MAAQRNCRKPQFAGGGAENATHCNILLLFAPYSAPKAQIFPILWTLNVGLKPCFCHLRGRRISCISSTPSM
jgi:hypothetical protein